MRIKQTLIVLLVLALAVAAGIYFLNPSGKAKSPNGAENVFVPANDNHGAHEGEPKALGHGEEKGHGQGAQEGQGENTAIALQAAQAAGIKVEAATGAAIFETVRLTGRITLNQNATAQVKARFAGIVRSVKKGAGETVQKDEVLATVESNESLQVYAVKAPLDGVILSRSTNVGDVAAEQPMFTITNAAEIWAEFHVFPRDMDRVQAGQKVFITSYEGEHRGEAVISTLLPVAEASSQTVVARVTLPNPDKVWRAGMTVRGDVVISEQQVAVAVKNSAIQRMEGSSVVFVQEGEKYEARPIRTGIGDGQFTQVLDGLAPGERYVSENSFQIKANIGKAGAAHEH